MIFQNLKIGDSFEYYKFIDTAFVKRFAQLSEDNNPIHIDEEFAKASIFGNRIIHGMIVGSIFSKIIASDFPGPGSIYLHQELNIKKPHFHNSELKITFKILGIKSEKQIVEIETLCFVGKEMVVDGKAIVKCL